MLTNSQNQLTGLSWLKLAVDGFSWSPGLDELGCCYVLLSVLEGFYGDAGCSGWRLACYYMVAQVLLCGC